MVVDSLFNGRLHAADRPYRFRMIAFRCEVCSVLVEPFMKFFFQFGGHGHKIRTADARHYIPRGNIYVGYIGLIGVEDQQFRHAFFGDQFCRG
ncbi:hypothetical protein D3C87_1847060 [compost metagenome]